MRRALQTTRRVESAWIFWAIAQLHCYDSVTARQFQINRFVLYKRHKECFRGAKWAGRRRALMNRLFSPREQTIATLVSEGLSNREIAEQLGLSVGTIKLHVHHILLKAGKQNRSQIKQAKQEFPARQ